VAGEGGDRSGDSRRLTVVDGAAVGGQGDGLGEQVGGEALRGWVDGVRVVVRGHSVEADDGVEVDQAAQLVLGDLGERHPHGALQLGLGQAGQAGQVALGVVAGAPP
jgi:hypothetical protein